MNERQPLVPKEDETPSSSTPTIPSSLRVATNAMSLLSVFLFSGIIFGWAPLELLLVREGQYDELCGSTDGERNQTNDESDEQQLLCSEQVIKLQVIFTWAQFLLSFLSLPVGWLIDHSPKVVYFTVTAVMEVAGLWLFSVSDSVTNDHFILGFGLMAAGGSLTMLGAFPASFLLPERQPMILASISCLFDASSIVFFVFHRFDLRFGWSRESMFAALAASGIVVYSALALCWFFLERLHWKDALDEEKKQDKPHHDNLPPAALHKQSLRVQLATPEFVLAVVFASVHMLRCNYYIMTVDDFLRNLGDSEGFYANIFSFVLPGGIVFVPLIEATVIRLGVQKTLHLTNVMGVIFGILLFVPLLDVQIVTFAVFACFRAYLYSTVNTFIAFHFGVETMGTVIGCTFTTAAVVSLLQYPAAIYSGSGHWVGVNVIMLSLCCIPIVMAACYREARTTQPLSPAVKKSILGSPLMTKQGKMLLTDFDDIDEDAY